MKIAYTWQSDFTYGIYVARKDGDAAAIKAALKTLREEGFFARLAEKYGLNPTVFDVDYDS